MIERLIQQAVLQSLDFFPAVGLIGARQVGKTTLAKMISENWPGEYLYLDMESPTDQSRLEDAELFLSAHESKLVIIDEIQRRGDLFPLLRSLIDRNRRPGRFLILGSASPSLKRQASESLAGRIAYHELYPFSILEVPSSEDKQLKSLWIRGGYPNSFLAPSDELSLQWRKEFIQTHLERDLPNLGVRIHVATLDRFWRMLGHYHGQLWNASQIAGSLGVTGPTVKHYLNVLQDTFMLRLLMPYHVNLKKRLVKTPKVYLRDSGLLHALRNLQTWDEILAHPIAGASWEGFLVEQIFSMLPSRWDAYFYRTQVGAEIDLLLIPPGGQKPIAVEFKYSLSPKLTKGFYTAMEDTLSDHAYVVYPGQDHWPLAGNITVLPAHEIETIFHESN